MSAPMAPELAQSRPPRTAEIAGMVAGVLLFLGSPLAAYMMYLARMQRVISLMGDSGTADPARMSAEIGATIKIAAAGLAGALIGLTILIVSIVLYVKAGRGPAPLRD